MRLPVISIIIAICCTLRSENLPASEAPKPPRPEFKALADPPGIHNLFRAGASLFSGSTPEGEEGFASLAKLGVKTVISVDGAMPEVELARKHGLRYVHLPHGYDGIGTNLQLQLAKAAESLPGTIYVHCHHGKHRGPAAAAVICMAREGWSAEQADAWLRAAGTSTNYQGLYDTVKGFRKPEPEVLERMPAEFPETAKVSGLVEAMVSVDERWENLKKVRAAGYRPPEDHPDIKPANEAVILWELYRESQRLPETAQHGSDMSARFKAAEGQVKEAEALLREFGTAGTPDVRARLDQSFEAIGKTCASCHKAHRDASGARASH